MAFFSNNKKKKKDMSIRIIDKNDCGYNFTEEEMDHITDDDHYFNIHDQCYNCDETSTYDDYDEYEHDGLDAFGVEEEADDDEDDDYYYDDDDDDDDND